MCNFPDYPFTVRVLPTFFNKITHKQKIEDPCLCAILQFSADKFHGLVKTDRLH